MSARETSLVIFLIVLVGIYILWNSRTLREGPTVSILSPQPETRIEAPLILEGAVNFVDEITINDRAIFITPEKTFREVIALPKGYNEIEIFLKGRDGREKIEKISYIVE